MKTYTIEGLFAVPQVCYVNGEMRIRANSLEEAREIAENIQNHKESIIEAQTLDDEWEFNFDVVNEAVSELKFSDFDLDEIKEDE